MRIRESTYCPHCHYSLQFMVRTPSTYSKGCPIKICPNCHKKFMDMRCKEQALRPYHKIDYFMNLFYSLCISVGGSIFAFFAIAIIAEEEKATTAFMIYFIVATFIPYLLMCITQNKNSDYFMKLWQESDARLRNVEYAKMLANAGFKVPKHYLPEGFEPKSSLLNILKI